MSLGIPPTQAETVEPCLPTSIFVFATVSAAAFERVLGGAAGAAIILGAQGTHSFLLTRANTFGVDANLRGEVRRLWWLREQSKRGTRIERGLSGTEAPWAMAMAAHKG